MRPTPFGKAAAFAAPALSALGWLILAAPAWAQDDDPTFSLNEPLSLDEPLTADALVAWVLRENRGLDAAEAAAQAAAYRIEPAGSLDDPMLNVGAAPRSSEQNIDFSQRLPWPGTLKAREAAARYEATAADFNVGVERLTLASAAKSAYAEWYFAARGLEILHQVQALVEELIATAETRYAAGRALQQDVLQAEVERAELETQELRLLREQAAARARINGLLNRPPDAPLPPAEAISTDLPALDAEALEGLALSRHPELRRLDAEIAAAESRVTVARKAFFPDFQIRAGYNTLWEDPEKRAQFGISINIPFDRGKRQAELDRTQAERRRAESTLTNERAQLLADVARARAEVVEAVQTIEVYEEQLLPLASEYLQAAIADYQSGTGAFLNVITAEQRRLKTELALERTRADYLRRVAELELLTGGPLDALAPQSRGDEE
ncbi:MAG TPA: TolC family protein [Steroidobacteraceae bacterium]